MEALVEQVLWSVERGWEDWIRQAAQSLTRRKQGFSSVVTRHGWVCHYETRPGAGIGSLTCFGCGTPFFIILLKATRKKYPEDGSEKMYPHCPPLESNLTQHWSHWFDGLCLPQPRYPARGNTFCPALGFFLDVDTKMLSLQTCALINNFINQFYSLKS